MVEEVRGDFMDDGKVWFTVRANNTPENVAIHAAFKNYSKIECDNNYTLGLRTLMEYKQADYKYEMLYAEIAQLKQKFQELSAKIEPKKKEMKEEGTF